MLQFPRSAPVSSTITIMSVLRLLIRRTLIRKVQRALVTSVILLLLIGNTSAQQLNRDASSTSAQWLQQLVPHNSLSFRHVPSGSTVTLRAIYGGEVVNDLNYEVTTETDLRIEVAAFLLESYNLPCDDTPALYVNIRSSAQAGGNSRERTACMPNRPRNMLQVALPIDDVLGASLPQNTWFPVLALEAIPEKPPITYPENLVIFYAILSTDDALPPLPEPSHPGAVVRILRESFD